MSVRPGCALILTAGLGERLRPLTDVRAKPAVPVAGDPLIRRLLARLPGQGIREVVLNLHYKPDTIARVVGDGADLGVRVRYSWEQLLLGSAGGPRRALPLLDTDRCFIVNGDTLTDVDLQQVAGHHERVQALVTMALIPNPAPERYGGVLLDEEGWVRGFTRPGDPVSSYHFIGVQVVERSVFAHLSDGEKAESVGGVYRALLAPARRALAGFVCEAGFQDIGTPADYLSTSLEVCRAEGRPELPPGRGARIHPTATVVRTAVWDDVEIGAHAEVIDCVVTDGARVAANARFRGQAIVRAGGRAPRETEQLIDGLLVVPIVTRNRSSVVGGDPES